MEIEGTIRLARAFCSARDRNVPVLRREGGRSAVTSAPAASGDLPQLVSCLDYGVRCTGWLCPLFTLPTLPPEELLAEAVQVERDRKRKSIADGRAILERAVKEGGQVRRERERRAASRRPPREGPHASDTSGTRDEPSAGRPHPA